VLTLAFCCLLSCPKSNLIGAPPLRARRLGLGFYLTADKELSGGAYSFKRSPSLELTPKTQLSVCEKVATDRFRNEGTYFEKCLNGKVFAETSTRIFDTALSGTVFWLQTSLNTPPSSLIQFPIIPCFPLINETCIVNLRPTSLFA
jgi:hypothetical protein